MAGEKDLGDIANTSKIAFYSLLLYDAARHAKRRNIVSVIAEGSFRGNTKYAFLQLNRIFRERKIDCEIVWFGGPKDHEILTTNGYRAVIWDKSWQAADIALHSKVALHGNFDWASERSFQRQICLTGAERVYLGHGVPAKHIGYTQIESRENIFSFSGMVQETLGYRHVVSESENLEDIYKAAFPSAKVWHLGSCRNDIFASTEPLSGVYLHGLIESNYEKVVAARQAGKKVVLYAPTYREKAQDLSFFINSVNKLYESIASDDSVFVVAKYHPGFRHYASSDTASLYDKREGVLLLADNEDINPYLRETDAIITDYSSVYYDYLLMNRPIIFFQPDRAEYESRRRRKFYSIEDEVVIGPIVTEPSEVIGAIIDQLAHPELHAGDRSRFAAHLHQFGNDGKSGERLADALLTMMGIQ